MIIVYDCSFIVLANGITIVNYDRKEFIVQATGDIHGIHHLQILIKILLSH